MSGTASRAVSNRLLTFRFEMGLLYATQLHANQVRKGGGIPYVGHLLGVASTVIEAGGDEDQTIAALLHDAIEDQGITSEEIASLFGPRVARIVGHVSDTAPEGEQRAAANSWQRKMDYLAHLRDADEDALLVSLADKLFNARSILRGQRANGESVWERFNVPKEQQLWYYRALVDTFKGAKNFEKLGPMTRIVLEELEAVVVELGA